MEGKNRNGKSDTGSSRASVDVDRITSMLRTWVETGRPQGQANIRKAMQLEEFYKTNMTALVHPEEMRELPVAAAQLYRSMNGILPVLAEFSCAIALELEKAAKLVKDITLMCGITLLTDDLLANIFDLVLEHSEHKARSAMILSHVSRRFRSVALETSSLWTCVRGGSRYIRDVRQQAQNTAFLNRAGVAPLDVSFDLHSNKNVYANLSQFMTDVLPHGKHWGHFRLNFEGGKIGIRRFFRILERFGVIQLPSLQRLTIDTKFVLNSCFEDELLPFSLCTIPGLKSLNLVDFAMDLRRFPTLTDISISTKSRAFPFDLLFDSLRSLPAVRSLRLGLSTNDSRIRPAVVMLPSILHLSFDIVVSSDAPHREILTMLYCPNVVSLSISVEKGHLYERNPSNNVIVDTYFDKIFNDSKQRYQHLSRLHVKMNTPTCITIGNEGLDAFGYSMKEYRLTTLALPKLSHLILEGTMSGPRLVPRQKEKGYLPILKTVTVRSRRPEKMYKWLLKVIGAQDLQGLGEDFEHLRIVKHDQQGETVESMTLPKVEALEWLESKMAEGISGK